MMVGAHANLAEALSARGDLDEAIAAYRETVRINPGFAAAYCNLGSALRRQGNFEEAIVHIARYRHQTKLLRSSCQPRRGAVEIWPVVGKPRGHGTGVRLTPRNIKYRYHLAHLSEVRPR